MLEACIIMNNVEKANMEIIFISSMKMRALPIKF